MYKIISLLAFLIFLAQTFSFAANTDTNFDLEEEEYVNDIPFNTGDIIGFDLDTNSESKASKNKIYFREEMIVLNNIMNISFDLNEEEYIDDIPFSTENIVYIDPIFSNVEFIANFNIDFKMEDEAYVDDIPFNTCDVVKKIKP